MIAHSSAASDPMDIGSERATPLPSRLFLRFAVFFFIFGPVVNVGLGAFGDSLSLGCLLLSSVAIIRGTFGQDMPKPVRSLMLILVATILYGLLSSALLSGGAFALQIVLRPLRAMIMLAGIYIFTRHYARCNQANVELNLLRDVYIAISAHAILMVVEFLHPPLRDFIYPYTFADQVDPFNQMFRMAGLTNGGGAQLSMFQAVGVLLWPIVAFREAKFSVKFIYFIFFVCGLASLVLSGRSGILLVAVMLPIIIAFLIWNYGRPVINRIVLPMLVTVVLGSLTPLLMDSLSDNVDGGEYLETAVSRSLEFFTGDRIGQNDGAQALSQMFFLPDSPAVLLLGDPVLFEASYKMEARIVKSDVGYVNVLYGYGVIGSVIQYSFYALILVSSIRFWRHAPLLALISIIWTISLALAHFKEVLFFTRIGYSLSLMFYIGLLYEAMFNRSNRRQLTQASARCS